MVPTGLGIVLVQGYKLIDKDLVTPTVRAYIEKEIDAIAKGTVSKATVMRAAIKRFSLKFQTFVNEIEKMDALFEASFTSAETSKIYTRCGKTMRYLRIISSRPPRLYNPLTEDIYIMPLGGKCACVCVSSFCLCLLSFLLFRRCHQAVQVFAVSDLQV